jgi:predicted dinucleotide-binding enzyme
MSDETRDVYDPFFGKLVKVSDRLTDRLRGRYAVGPTLPNGEPEFGWREHEVPPIQRRAADEIDSLVASAKVLAGLLARSAAEVDDLKKRKEGSMTDTRLTQADLRALEALDRALEDLIRAAGNLELKLSPVDAEALRATIIRLKGEKVFLDLVLNRRPA